MTTVFITGDRSMSPAMAFGIVVPVITKIAHDNPEGIRFVTGDAVNGVERAVRYFLPEQFVTVVSREQNAEGHVDFDKSSAEAAGIADYAVVIHTDPLNSRLAKSVAQAFTKVEFPLDEIINATPDDASALFDEKETEEKPES